MSPRTDPDIALSQSLQPIAAQIDRLLARATGIAKVPFLLVAAPAVEAQYVANISRDDAAKILKGLLQRWDNPTLPDLAVHQNVDTLLVLLAACRAYHDALDSAFAQLAEATRAAGLPVFMPSRSPMWPAIEGGRKAIAAAEALLAASELLRETGTIEAPPESERH